MNGTQKMKKATVELEWKLLGEENGGGLLAGDFSALKAYYQHARFFLALNEKEFEDGYNLSMLEAMMCGCPAVTLNHPTSPIEHGRNGFRSDDLQELNRLMRETPHEKLMLMGQEARKIVIDKFPMHVFIDRWNKILQKPL